MGSAPTIEATEDGFAVLGRGGLRGGTIDAAGDHRLAMMGAVAGLASREGVQCSGWRPRPCPTRASWPIWARLPADVRPTVLIAIDGPAGAGKSTVARALARRLGFTYLDSGAMYRCVGLRALGSPEQPPPPCLRNRFPIAFAPDADPPLGRVLLDGRDVSEEIRTPEVSEAASRVAADPGVREALVAKQRELIASRRLGGRGSRHRHGRRT